MRRALISTITILLILAIPAAGQLKLKQSTAVTLKIGPFVDKTDGSTAETALTIHYDHVKLSKNGGAFAAKSDTTNPAHDAGGWYSCVLNTTDTGTLGILKLYVYDANCAYGHWESFEVVTANVYDSQFSTDKLEVDPVQWNGTAVATPDTAGYPKVTIKDGTGVGEIDTSGGALAQNVSVGAMTYPALKDFFDTDSTTTYGAAVAGSVVKEIADNANVTKLGGSATPVTNLNNVFNTDYATAFNEPNGVFNVRLVNVSEGAGLITEGTGSGQISLSNGQVTVGTNNDKTGYALSATQTFNVTGSITGNLSGSVGSVTGAVGSVTGAVGSVTGNVGGNVTGSVGSMADAGASLSAIPWNAAWDAQVESEVVDGIGTGSALTAIPWNSAWDAQVESEAADALVFYHLDHLLAATYDPAAKPGAADALFNEIIENDGGVSRYTANALEQAPSGGGGLTAEEVWEDPNAFSPSKYPVLAEYVWEDPNATAASAAAVGEAVWEDPNAPTVAAGAVTVGTNNDKTGYALTSAYDAAKTTLTPTTAIDGQTIESLYECLLAWMAGRVTVVDQGSTRVLSFYKRNGSSVQFSVTVSDVDGSRAGTGTIN